MMRERKPKKTPAPQPGRGRFSFLFATFGLLLLILAGRLVYLQVINAPELAAMATGKVAPMVIEATRGDVVDRQGRVLAGSQTTMLIGLDPKVVREAQAKLTFDPAEALAPLVGKSPEELRTIIEQPDARWVPLLRYASLATAKEVQALKIPGLVFEPQPQRYYPEGTLAAQILGFVGVDDENPLLIKGRGGLEAQFDERLAGAPGQRDPSGLLPEVPARPGQTLRLTIDNAIQHLAEEELAYIVEVHQPLRAAILVQETKTGRLLAVAETPGFDPNHYAAYDPATWRLWTLSDGYEPGSIIKPLIVAAALDQGVVGPTELLDDPGSIKVADVTLWNHGFVGYGAIDLGQVLAHSSNVALVQLGSRLGVDRFYDYFEAWGFGQPTGVGLPGESAGLHHGREEVKNLPVDFATMAYGQGFSATPFQMISAISALANDGKLMRPQIIAGWQDQAGRTLETFEPEVVRQVVKPEVARHVKELMVGVIETGTGGGARVPGYPVAGKTGSADKYVDGVVSGKWVASFVGFAPADQPEVTILVAIDEAQGDRRLGGEIAAPAFARLLPKVLRYLEVPPATEMGTQGVEVEKVKVPVPPLINLTVDEARAQASQVGLELQVDGKGSVVTGQADRAGTLLEKGSKVRVQAEEGLTRGSEEIRVPDLGGLTLREASDLASRWNLTLEVTGSGLVVEQEPAPGTPILRGGKVKAQLAPPGSAAREE